MKTPMDVSRANENMAGYKAGKYHQTYSVRVIEVQRMSKSRRYIQKLRKLISWNK